MVATFGALASMQQMQQEVWQGMAGDSIATGRGKHYESATGCTFEFDTLCLSPARVHGFTGMHRVSFSENLLAKIFSELRGKQKTRSFNVGKAAEAHDSHS